jgi:cyclopropane fatty-acyl-phospholipid synthase-like methyltransferase
MSEMSDLEKEYTNSNEYKLEQSFIRLKAAVEALYYSAYWASDRLSEEQENALWIELRDAAGFEPGQTIVHLGPSHFA